MINTMRTVFASAFLTFAASAAFGQAPLDRELDCRNPQDAPLCREIQRDQETRRGMPPAAQYGRPPVPTLCPEGREIRSRTFYPSNMTDCDVVRAAKGREDQDRKLQQENEKQKIAAEMKEREQRHREIDEDSKSGYTSISFEDFELDARDLIKSGKKVAIIGTYNRAGNVERIFPSQMALLMAARNGSTSSIALLTEDAPRGLRAYFLRCNNSPASALGCWARVRGHVTMCELTSLMNSMMVPCLAVDGGWTPG